MQSVAGLSRIHCEKKDTHFSMDNEKEYQQALDFLYSFVDFSLSRQLQYSPEKFNLLRMRRLLELMENPHLDFPVVHVTGTKGKGSTCAFIASILKQAGYQVGLYTSPHLLDYAERIQVDQKPIQHEDLVGLLNELKPMIQQVPDITTFEITTALAFCYFARKHVDIAVLEVGLGGRLDATNVVDPLVSVITTISYDHQAVLGNTLAAIASEKAGIIKPGRPVVTSSQQMDAIDVLADVAARNGSPVIQVGRDVHYASTRHNLDGQECWIWTDEDQARMDHYIETGSADGWKPDIYQIPLLGAHQLENATTAYCAIRMVQSSGFKITEEAIQKGMANVFWPCRFEILSKEPYIVLDSAHNRDSALKLRISLDDYFPDKEVILIFGASEDKDVRGMMIDLIPRVNQVIATQSVHPRALAADEIVKYVHQMGRKAQVILPLEEAFQRAKQIARKDQVILVTGSIFLAAAIRGIFSSDRL